MVCRERLLTWKVVSTPRETLERVGRRQNELKPREEMVHKQNLEGKVGVLGAEDPTT